MVIGFVLLAVFSWCVTILAGEENVGRYIHNFFVVCFYFSVVVLFLLLGKFFLLTL